MQLWRLTASRHASTAMSGEGAAAFGGRWNPAGRRMVYTAQSLALATLELSVHITGGRVKYVAIQFELADHLVDALALGCGHHCFNSVTIRGHDGRSRLHSPLKYRDNHRDFRWRHVFEHYHPRDAGE